VFAVERQGCDEIGDAPYRSGCSPDWMKVKNPDAPAATRVMEW